MLLQSAAMVAKKLLENDKITAWIKQKFLLGVLCKILNKKTLSGETFCFWGNLLFFYELLIGPQPPLYCIVVFLQLDWSTLSKWPRLQ